MQHYRNLSGQSGVTDYEIGHDWIIVQFAEGATYRYDHATTGWQHVERMKLLARTGRGLSGYIAQHARERYAEKIA
jgi:hypothetical protein